MLRLYDPYVWDLSDKDDGEMSPRQHDEILRGRAMGLRVMTQGCGAGRFPDVVARRSCRLI